MKKFLILVVLLIIPTAVYCFSPAYMGGSKTSSGGGGGDPDTWYYPAGISEDSDDGNITSGWAWSTYVYGDAITPAQGGTISKFAIKVIDAQGASTIEAALYDDSNNALDCTGSLGLSAAAAEDWYNLTASGTECSVTGSTAYRVFTTSTDNNNLLMYDSSESGLYATCANASFPCDPAGTSPGTDNGMMVAICVGTCTDL